jgi:hypothetical protein
LDKSPHLRSKGRVRFPVIIKVAEVYGDLDGARCDIRQFGVLKKHPQTMLFCALVISLRRSVFGTLYFRNRRIDMLIDPAMTGKVPDIFGALVAS